MSDCPPEVEAVRAWVEAQAQPIVQLTALDRCALIVAILQAQGISCSLDVMDVTMDIGDGRPLRVFGFDLSQGTRPDHVFDWRGNRGWEMIVMEALPPSHETIYWAFSDTPSKGILELELARQTASAKAWIQQSLAQYQVLRLDLATPLAHTPSPPRRTL